MVRPAFAVGRVAVARENDLGREFVGADVRGIEILDLEPQQDAVAIGAIVGITDRPMVMRDIEPVQLEDEGVAGNQPFVLGSSVRAQAAEKMLIPATARFHICDRYEGLGTHPSHLS